MRKLRYVYPTQSFSQFLTYEMFFIKIVYKGLSPDSRQDAARLTQQFKSNSIAIRFASLMHFYLQIVNRPVKAGHRTGLNDLDEPSLHGLGKLYDRKGLYALAGYDGFSPATSVKRHIDLVSPRVVPS